ncbi:ligand-gated ion channel [Streptomyces halobius]|uniref:Neurotransmitter-gated ion-channel ligand-binding domain-containing protein n=1 Tax=Streptomyces halobius TaxID=2879846 RepID=A0ABY4MG64_9ACTN|nr:hypothetical protein [Streptomyces halobius]UQA96804.1 hypothetical protein K9S39_37435 [Streptomyces halobius]
MMPTAGGGRATSDIGRRVWRLHAALRVAAVAVVAWLWVSAVGSALAAPASERPHALQTPPMSPERPRMAETSQAHRWVTCKVGAYVTAVHDINPVAGSFRADLWVWSLCPDKRQDPLKLMEFTNANEVKKSLDTSAPMGGVQWGNTKVTGSFRVDWDTRSFPFDRHRLVIAMEPVDDISESRYVPDTENSTYAPDAIPGEWRATSFRLAKSRHTYPTTFGDPTREPRQGSTYDRLEVRIDVARAEYTSFVKLTGPVYVAATITLVIFIPALDSVEVMLGRLGLLGAVVFAIVLNMQQSSATIGSETALTLTDEVHILSLVFTIIMIGINVTLWRASSHGDGPPDHERRWVLITVVTYVLSNLVLISLAAIAG